MKIRFQFNVSVFKKADGKATESFSAGNDSFVTCVKKEIANARDRGSFSTAANYDTAIRSLLTFLERDDIKVKDITSDMLENYQKWLLRRNVSLNTISCYMRSLRSIYNRVTKNKGDVFVKTFTGSTPTFKRSLCINDIQRLSILKLPKRSRLALTRDLFLFSFYCQGMPFIDLAFLKKAQIVNGQIIYHRRKTGQIIHITIEPCIIRKSKFSPNPKRSVHFSSVHSKRNVQKKDLRTTQTIKPEIRAKITLFRALANTIQQAI